MKAQGRKYLFFTICFLVSLMAMFIMEQTVHAQDSSQTDNQAVTNATATSSMNAVKKNKVISVDVNELIIKSGLKPIEKQGDSLNGAESVSPDQGIIESKDVAEPKKRLDDVNIALKHFKNKKIKTVPAETMNLETTVSPNRVVVEPIKKSKKPNVEIKQLEKEKIKNPTPFQRVDK